MSRPADPAGEGSPDATDPAATDTDDTTGWEDRWYTNSAALTMIALDLLAVLAVAVGTTNLLDDALGVLGFSTGTIGSTVPYYVYAYAALGALGYVLTTVIREIDRSAAKVLHANLRIPAALPLAAGLYLFGVQILGDVPSTRLLAGLAFIAGLYVNLTYERIGALADRLLPSGEEDTTGGAGAGSGPDSEERSGTNSDDPVR